VPHQNPTALATALRRVLTEPGLAAGLVGRAPGSTATLEWPAVAARYDDLGRTLLAERPTALAAATA